MLFVLVLLLHSYKFSLLTLLVISWSVCVHFFYCHAIVTARIMDFVLKHIQAPEYSGA